MELGTVFVPDLDVVVLAVGAGPVAGVGELLGTAAIASGSSRQKVDDLAKR
jgi:hypothetical protein